MSKSVPPRFWLVIVLALASAVSGSSAQGPAAVSHRHEIDGTVESHEQPAATPESIVRQRIKQVYGQVPLSFEANLGQTDAQVDFLARGPGYTLFLTGREAVFALLRERRGDGDTSGAASRKSKALPPRVASEPEFAVLRMKLVGANPHPHVAAQEELPGRNHYFIGNDPAKWRTNISTHAKVKYAGVYPGVDLVYYGNQHQFEYDFVVAPGADPNLITFAFDGTRDVHIDARGELVLGVEGGELRQHAPLVYQEVAGIRNEVAGRYVMKGKHQVGFQVAAYDRSHPLIIDPVLIYSTFLGGTGSDTGYGIAVDAAGSAYVTGETLSTNFPTTVGAAQTANAGNRDAFVTKLNATGSMLLYSTYLGGSGADSGYGIDVDSAGSAYVTGSTTSSNFPTTVGAAQPGLSGSGDAFVTKLDATGAAPLYSTYLGGTAGEVAWGVAVDVAGSAYVTGFTTSLDFPTSPAAAQTATAGGNDAFVTKLDAAGSTRLYSTYLGGSGSEVGEAIAVDAAGSAYVTGSTTSTNFPTTAGAAQTTSAGVRDAFVTKVNAIGSVHLYSTYLGGSGDDFAFSIAVDAAASAYVTGETLSTNFPTTAGAAQTTTAGTRDAFVTKLDAIGSARLYSTYLGGGSVDAGQGIAVDSAGSAFVTGFTVSTNFPTTPGAIQTAIAGNSDFFVTQLNASGSARLYSTYYGGILDETGWAIALDATGNAYVTGSTASMSFPTTSGVFQPTRASNPDSFVVKIEFVVPPGPPATLMLSPAADTNPVNSQHCVTATVQDANGIPSSNVMVRFTVTGAVNTSGSAMTNSSGVATFCYMGPALPGADAITAYADTDNDNTQDVGEPSGAATKTWVQPPPATLTLSPPAATNPVGSQHCVTATVEDAFGNPVPNVRVRLAVTGSVNTSGSATTNGNGEATFCYTGPALPGADAITAYADTDNDNTQDVGEPGGAATKAWVLPASTPLCEIKITGGGRITAANGDMATFGGNAKSDGDSNTDGQEQYQDHGPAEPLNVHSINVLAIVCESTTEATIYGEATIDGEGSFSYRIRVRDLGEPGVGRDTYGIVLENGYASGEQTLEGGNIQIHRD